MRRFLLAVGGASLLTGLALTAPTGAPARAFVLMPPELSELSRPVGSSTPLQPADGASDPDVPVAPDAGAPRTEPAVTVDPTDPRHVVVAMNDYAVPNAPRGSIYRSSDGGRTFRGPLLFDLRNDAEYSGDPSLASGPDGSAYFSFAEYGATGVARAGGIYVARSRDGGQHWAHDIATVARSNLTNSGGRCHFEDKDEVTVDPRNGDVYVAWTDYDYDGSSYCGNAFSPAVIARSTDGGRTFSHPVPVSSTGVTVGAMPRVGPDGTVYVAYSQYAYDPTCGPTSTAFRMIVARSTDGLRHFTASTALPKTCGPSNPSTTGGTYRTYSFPSFEVLPGGALVLATIEQSGATDSLVIVRSTDGGRSWQRTATPTMQPGAQYQFPRLAEGPHGLLALSYVEQQPGGLFSVLLSTARRGGRAWTAPVTVSSEMSAGTNPSFQGSYDGDYNGLAIDRSGVAHPAWTDIRAAPPSTGLENIWTRRVPLQ